MEDKMTLVGLLQDLSGWLAAGFSGLLAWVAKRHFDDDHERHKAAADRLHELETNHVTISDLKALERQLSAARAEMADNHAEVLKLLLDRKG